MILPKSIITAFAGQPQSELKDTARYTIAHELAHADEQHRCGQRFSAELIELHRTPDPFKVGRLGVWSEYYVCRKVASAHPAILPALEEVLVRTTEGFGNDCATARARIAASNDKARVQGELVSSAFRFFMVSGRILGHLDGLEREFESVCQTGRPYLEEWELTSTFQDLHRSLRDLWGLFPNWHDLDELHSIVVVMDSRLKRI